MRTCRNVRPSVTATAPNVLARGALEIRVCVRTYRLFYVPHTEDFLLHALSEDEKAMMGERKERLKERQQVWAKEVESGEWSERRMSTSAAEAEAADPAPEGSWGPSTGVGPSTEAGPGPIPDGGMSASVESAVVDHDVGASVSAS